MKPNRNLLDDHSHGIQTSELNPVFKGLNDVIPANPLQLLSIPCPVQKGSIPTVDWWTLIVFMLVMEFKQLFKVETQRPKQKSRSVEKGRKR